MKVQIPPLKLLHVASGDLWAGAEVQVFYLCRQLFKQGIDVHVVLFNRGTLADRLIAEGVPVVVFDETQLRGINLLGGFIRHLRQLRPTVIHTHGHKENVLVGFANALTLRVPAVRTTHGANEINEPIWKVHKHLIHWLDRWAGHHLQQAIVAVSPPLAELLANTFAAQKIHVIENAIDVDYVEALAQQQPILKIPDTEFAIAVVGRLVPVKRQDILLRALALLLPTHPQLRLYIIGDGPLATGLRDLVQQLGVGGRVEFTGALDPIYPVLARMSLLAMPSDHEGLPMTLLEAMALRVPVVAHAVGGIVPVTHSGELAWLVEDHSERGYAEVISAVLANFDTARERARHAADHVKRHYDIALKYREYLTLYQKLLQSDNVVHV